MDKILLLHQIEGFGLKRIKNYIKENIFFMEDDGYFEFTIKSITGRNINYYQDRVKQIKDDCNRLGVEIIYNPNQNIVNPPILLFVKGDKNLIGIPKIGIIGTRNPSGSLIEEGRRYINQVLDRGFPTVSGLANGWDQIAHKETVDYGRKTVAVLPMGYKKDTAPWILESGLIISEYAPETSIKKYKCINRNRIIAGMSNGLFIVEGYKDSGCEHTMGFAAKNHIPICHLKGFTEKNKYNSILINNRIEFDLFLKKCIN